MLSLSMFNSNDNLEAPNKHTRVFITHETHPGEEKSTACSHQVSPSGHMSHNGASIKYEFYGISGDLKETIN